VRRPAALGSRRWRATTTAAAVVRTSDGRAVQLCFAVEELTMAKLVVEVEEISVLAWLGGGCERERESSNEGGGARASETTMTARAH